MACVTFQIFGFGFEAFVFAYLGLTFSSYTSSHAWSWSFILIELLIIPIGRFFGTVVLIYILVLFKHRKRIEFRELLFISYAGLIRGAIAFGLVLRIEPNIKEKDVIVTTALTLVIITTLLFGSLMPLVQRWLVPHKPEDTKEVEEEKKLAEGKSEY